MDLEGYEEEMAKQEDLQRGVDQLPKMMRGSKRLKKRGKKLMETVLARADYKA